MVGGGGGGVAGKGPGWGRGVGGSFLPFPAPFFLNKNKRPCCF